MPHSATLRPTLLAKLGAHPLDASCKTCGGDCVSAKTTCKPRVEPVVQSEPTPTPTYPPEVQAWLDGRELLVEARGNASLGYRVTKRAADIVGALAILMVLSPVMLVTWIALTITTRGKAIFSQDRVGHQGRFFRMYKFRTMVLDASKLQHLVQNEKDGPVFKNRRDPRITRIGRILRSFSIDETPQLFNILLGHMSLVGPRPPLPLEVAQYQPRQRLRLAVKPGLTCLWQVSGRCEIGFDEWVRMDLWYVQRQSLVTDLALLIRTPLSVLSRKGAY